jgi:calcium/calmodulin-dependent protein kinase I
MKHLSLKEALLPQPPSFLKKQSYEIHEILGSGTFGKVMRATWQVPPDLTDVSRQGAYPTSPSSPTDHTPGRSSIPLLHPHHMKRSISRASNSSTPPSPGGHNHVAVVKEVALKVIPKKKVKGNEAAVWGEMDVLKGLDHHNIVRVLRLVFLMRV